MSEQERLQIRVNHWMDDIRELDEDMEQLRRGSPEWEGAMRVRRECEGRIYAARVFAKVLGLDLDTDCARIA